MIKRVASLRRLFNAILLFAGISFTCNVHAQDESALVKKVKAKLDKVNDYKAEGKMKIDVSFIRAPQSKVIIYYKKPDKFRVKKDGGISILPKGGISINLNTIISSGNYAVVPAGEIIIGGVKLKVVKLLPLEENSAVVLTTLSIDEKKLLIQRASVTTRESGTYEMALTYGKYSDWGLPDKIIFSFNTKDYKLPKGVTFEYDNGKKPEPDDPLKNKKGKVEISYSSYVINKGVNDNLFE